MNSDSCKQQVIAELIGKKTYRPLIRLHVREEHAEGRDETQIVKGFALYRKSLQIIPSGPYTLRFAVNGIRQEYAVRVANKTMVRADDKESQAA